MDQNFKKLLQLSRTNNNPLMRTFEGALFQESSWFLDSETESFSLEGAQQLPAAENRPVAAAPSPAPSAPSVAPASVAKGPAPLCEVLFLGDSYAGEGEDLLGRMIGAMKLTNGEFFRYPLLEALENVSDLASNLENPDEATKTLLSFIAEKRPKVVVSLGATVTNILLGRREKLSGIHGQFFDKQVGDCHFSLMPVFHPDFLLINPNMKRTAWIDLQKVMERVGKI